MGEHKMRRKKHSWYLCDPIQKRKKKKMENKKIKKTIKNQIIHFYLWLNRGENEVGILSAFQFHFCWLQYGAPKSESTDKSFKINGHRLKPFLINPSLVDVVVEETSLLHPTSLPPWLREFSFFVSFFTFIALVQIYWLLWLFLILWLCYIEDNVLFKCGGGWRLFFNFVGYSSLILLGILV